MSTSPSRITAVSLNVSREKGTIKEPVPEVTIDENGIVGDAHASPWHRQVSLLALESIERFSAEHGRPFACGAFAENITTRGLDLSTVSLLDRFTIGTVRLEVTQIGKKCHGDDCAVFREVGQCVMPKEGIFCRVLEGGVIRTNEAITYAPRPLHLHIITLSDRVSRGAYTDRSGPRIKTHLDAFFANRRWHTRIDSDVIPDEASTLRQRLETARDAGVDVVFTTGGTGVGPRDITPDVVTAIADRIIPGIMEYIRVRFGAEKPNALLSRSVAAVAGQTLIYTLPGSTKAVDEYMGEILKTLEHTLCMVHGLDLH